MKSLAAVFLLLLLLTGCAERTTPAQELEPAHTHPAETQDAEAPEAVETPEDPVTPEAPETPEAAVPSGRNRHLRRNARNRTRRTASVN